ncbi:PREDICTED: NDR1/HIN1-Like protein 3 [Tarenaya hassleriana]|uniref:NDR1/HIN1-Like protein 3 n=1 Tax=Tarenaya hassleriana TaxID=28532 RepID=UPI00053C8EBC|nr:PREDICTED: NDR1/HIN1-Like protein 3 [Tarenaya hassleriana]
MSDHQKIHPVNDPEAPPHPTAPLVPRGASRNSGRESPLQPKKRKRRCCCRCVCYTLCVLLLLVFLLGALAAILYLVFQPKIPVYSVDRLELIRFTLNQDSGSSATFNVTITAKNPNDKIGIFYEDGSKISVWHMQTKLSEGSLPKFYQGYKNTTVLYIKMTGQWEDTTGLMTTMQRQELETGNIPLRIRVNQPVKVKVGKLKLMEVRFLVRCGVAVNSLPPSNCIRIQSSSCKFSLGL